MLRHPLRNHISRRGAKALFKNDTNNQSGQLNGSIIAEAKDIAVGMVLKRKLSQQQLDTFNKQLQQLPIDEKHSVERLMEESMIEAIHERLLSVAPAPDRLRPALGIETRQMAAIMLRIADIDDQLQEASFGEKPLLLWQKTKLRLQLSKLAATTDIDWRLVLFTALCITTCLVIIIYATYAMKLHDTRGYVVTDIGLYTRYYANSSYSSDRWIGRVVTFMEHEYCDTLDHEYYERGIENDILSFGLFFGDRDTTLHPKDDHHLQILMQYEAESPDSATDYVHLAEPEPFSPYHTELDAPDSVLDADLDTLPHTTTRTVLKRL
eukprot:TRINITY_DN15169_c0_g1_i1.p1 TRINITY_DN15169_c0_g1~~TRINITY_DN15169_c0_g1_i1.p1  ORF type:complete len:323 (+),score=40.34 TRINITY_DN15169_c0_g1_i1:59-1027(+)